MTVLLALLLALTYILTYVSPNGYDSVMCVLFNFISKQWMLQVSVWVFGAEAPLVNSFATHTALVTYFRSLKFLVFPSCWIRVIY